MKENLISEKSFQFAIRIVNLYKFITNNHKEYVLSKQLVKSGTSIGAYIEEAVGCQLKADFIAKMSIAYKESRETHYWLRLLTDTEYLTIKQSQSMITDLNELLKILSKILKTSKNTNKKVTSYD